MTNGEIIIIACTFASIFSAISGFLWWRLARMAQDATQDLFNKFCNRLKSELDAD